MHELPGDFRGTHAMNVLQSKLPKYPGYHKSPNHCIKRLFESKTGFVDTPGSSRVFDLQGPLV